METSTKLVYDVLVSVLRCLTLPDVPIKKNALKILTVVSEDGKKNSFLTELMNIRQLSCYSTRKSCKDFGILPFLFKFGRSKTCHCLCI